MRVQLRSRLIERGLGVGMTTEERDAIAEPAVAELEIDLTGVVPLFEAASIYAMPRGIYLRWIKPAFDRTIGVVALILCAPLLAVIAFAVLNNMGSPVFFRQDRVGLHGRVFRLWKFRTMALDRRLINLEWLGADRRQTHKSADDPRITTLGKWLRSSRLDELPQFINVVRGELSMVGPRPELVPIVAKYEPWQHRRHAVKPGLTGLWQISDRGEKLLFECTEIELTYLETISIGADISILLRTIPAMARRSGV